MAPRFGMRLDGWMTPARCVELAVAAEQCGFDAVWFAENPFGRGVLPAASASLVATSRIRVGIGVFNPFNRHPSLIAMEMGALDELGGGRAQLGLGTGVQRMLAKASLDSDKPIAAMRDTISIVRGLLRGEAVHYEGKVFSSAGVKLEFELVRPDYPIYLASMGDQSIRLSGEIADGIMISNLCAPGFTRRAVEMIEANSAKRKVPAPITVVQYAPCVARPDRVEARDFAKGIVGGMFARSLGGAEVGSKAWGWFTGGSGVPDEDFKDMLRRLAEGTPPHQAVPDHILDLYAVAGDADDCLAAYRRYLDVGVSEMVVTFRGPEPLVEMAYLADALRQLSPR